MVPCWGCRRFFRLWLPAKYHPLHFRGRGVGRSYSDSSRQITDISIFLSNPSWSVRSLLPSPSEISPATRVTSEQLRHLLRLSALPPPRSPEEETQMLETLDSQLHFVREIQKVKTDLIAPLKSIRDESAVADSERGIGFEELKGTLETEKVGRKSSIVRQRNTGISEASKEAEDWEVLRQAERKVGRYFVVETGKK